jgi:hypothetical protein
VDQSKQKVTVSLTGEAIGAVREIALARGISVSEALRQAIGTEKFITDERSKGSKILIERPDQSLREVVIR